MRRLALLLGATTFVQDVRYGVRLLLKSPGFTAVIVFTLGLAIGANVAVFTLANGVLFGSLPFDKPEQLVVVWSTNLSRGQERMGVSHPDLEDFRAQAKSFKGLATFVYFNTNVTDPGRPAEEFRGARVSANAFSVLGQEPLLGRDFLPGEDAISAPSVAIIGHSLWQNRYGGDPDILGKAIRIAEVDRTVVGVMPPDMKFPNNEELWYPLRPAATYNQRGARAVLLFGRLADGVGIADAQVEMQVLAQRLEQQYPETNRGIGIRVEPYTDVASGGRTRVVFLAMLGAVGFVVLIACANVANLLLSRALARGREFSIRVALGASRTCLVRQMLIESLLLSTLGGVAGLLLSVWGVRWVLAAMPDAAAIPYWVDFSINARVFAYVAALCLGTGLIFGVAPALQASRVTSGNTLKEGARGTAGGRRRLLSNALVVSELALAVVLLAAAGLMIRSLLQQHSMSSALASDNVLTLQVTLMGARYTRNQEAVEDFFKRLAPELRTVAGAEAVAMALTLPVSGAFRLQFELDAQPVADASQRPTASGMIVSPEYFRVLGVSLLAGRAFTDDDQQPGRTVAIVNRRFADTQWPGVDPIGRRLKLSIGDPQPWLTVVGVAPDIRQNWPTEPELAPVIYVPFGQQRSPLGVVVMARSQAHGHTLIAPMRRMVERVNPEVLVTRVMTLREYFAWMRGESRLFTALFIIFAVIGLALACVGTYAVMAYSVRQRTQEIGIRMALGSQHRDILMLVVGHGLKLALVGAGVGLLGAFAVTRVMRSLLVGVAPTDVTTFAVVSVVLAAVAVLACFIPAWRAARVDPSLALRLE